MRDQDGVCLIDSTPLGRLLARDLTDGVPTPVLARRFHHWVGEAMLMALATLRQKTGLASVALSGGCMQNKVLFEILVERLEENGFTVFAGEQAPMNDGGIALGQAFIGGYSCA